MTVFDHLWQSTLVAIFVTALTLLFRHNSARVRYGLWLAASLKFLAPFSLLAALGRMMFVHTVPAGSIAVLTKIQPVAMPFSTVAPVSHHLPWLSILAAIWLLGTGTVAAVWVRRWARLRTIARAGEILPLDLPVPVRSTPILLEPGLVGIWRPVILLPEGIFRQLSRSEIDAILRHELCHLRRRDNLLAMTHMLVEALFWFHPLVWFIGARLVEEREKACDESVLAGGQNPLEYAEAILRVCRLYLRSPLPCASGVAGADLGRRVDAIMTRRDLDDIDPARKLLLAGLLFLTLMVPFATGGLRSAPPVQLVQRLASSLLAPAQEMVKPAVLARPSGKKTLHRPRTVTARAPDPVLHVEARTLEEMAPPTAPSLIVIPALQLDSDQQQAVETKVCRPPQQLVDSRLMGPQVCLPQREWDRLAAQNLVLMPDGQRFAAYYEKQHSKAAGGCPVAGHGASSASATSAGLCF